MSELAPISDLLAFQPMTKLAAALREQKETIMNRWDSLVRHLLPDADALTSKEVRNSIPRILDQMAAALAAAEPAPLEKLMEVTKLHGTERYHESYNVRELIAEYRILRRIIAEEVDAAFEGAISAKEWMALDMAVDISLQQAVLSFLEHQRTQLTAANESEAKFWSFLSHDLRSGLNNIMLTMQWVEHSLRAQPTLAEECEDLRRARASTADTIASMEQLLQAERFRQQKVVAKREKVSLKAIGTEVAGQLRLAARSKGLTVELDVPEGATVATDPGLLKLILQNILGNAIKYSEHGTIHIRGAESEAGDAWMLRVADQGQGIASDAISTIFDAFARGKADGQPGVGLGLFIAAQAAKTIGARITVESKVNDGSTFSIILFKRDVDEPQ